MTETFPALFARYEESVGVKEYEDYDYLRRQFVRWTGKRWINSAQQERGLRIEAEKRGIPVRRGPITKQQKLEQLKEERGAPFSGIFTFKRRGKTVTVRCDKRGRFVKRK